MAVPAACQTPLISISRISCCAENMKDIDSARTSSAGQDLNLIFSCPVWCAVWTNQTQQESLAGTPEGTCWPRAAEIQPFPGRDPAPSSSGYSITLLAPHVSMPSPPWPCPPVPTEPSQHTVTPCAPPAQPPPPPRLPGATPAPPQCPALLCCKPSDSQCHEPSFVAGLWLTRIKAQTLRSCVLCLLIQ